MPSQPIFSVRLEGLAEVRTRLAAFPPRFRRNVLRGAIRAAAVVLRTALRRLIAPFSRTGRLAKSAQVSTRAFPDGHVEGKASIGGRLAFYANVVETGAKAHDIVAIHARALTIGPGRFVHQVRHPGFTGRGFVAQVRASEIHAAERAFFDYANARIAAYIEA